MYVWDFLLIDFLQKTFAVVGSIESDTMYPFDTKGFTRKIKYQSIHSACKTAPAAESAALQD